MSLYKHFVIWVTVWRVWRARQREHMAGPWQFSDVLITDRETRDACYIHAALKIPGGRMVEDEEMKTSVRMWKAEVRGSPLSCWDKGTAQLQQTVYTLCGLVSGETPLPDNLFTLTLINLFDILWTFSSLTFFWSSWILATAPKQEAQASALTTQEASHSPTLQISSSSASLYILIFSLFCFRRKHYSTLSPFAKYKQSVKPIT